jgi:hypothetical protein
MKWIIISILVFASTFYVECWVSQAARAAAAAVTWVTKVGKNDIAKTWVQRVEQSRKNNPGNQGRGKQAGHDSRTSSGNK